MDIEEAGAREEEADGMVGTLQSHLRGAPTLKRQFPRQERACLL